MTQYAQLIDGALHGAANSLEVLDPATEQIVGQAPVASPEQVDAAVQAAYRAFAGWSADEEVRRRALAKAAGALEARLDEVARLITLEQGRPLNFTRGEVAGAVATLLHYAGFVPPAPPVLRDDAERYVAVERRPFGVVVAITPWNVPLILLVLKLAPALLAGNTVVAKPSESTPLSTLLFGEIVRDAFPAGVLNIVSGDGGVGQLLTEHPLVRKITFTGSVATGKKLFASAAQDVKRLTLELGGNDAALVLDDADPQKIAEAIFWGAFWNTGQVCFAIKRLYVHRSRYQRLTDILVERARRTVVGSGLEEGSELGPLTTRPQFDRVKSLVDDAVARGARVLVGGQPRAGAGYFYPPTIVTDVGAGVPLVDEEQFGPVLPVIPYDDLEEAIRQINDSPFGLGASVWTASEERGLAVVRRLQAGLGWVNQHLDIHPGAPKGGHKWSGLGYEGGLPGYEAFHELQTINVARG